MVTLQHDRLGTTALDPRDPGRTPVSEAFGPVGEREALLAKAEPDAPIIGLAPDGQPIIVDLRTAPRLLVSTAPAAGKSNEPEQALVDRLVKLVASHCLRHGGQVTLLDPHDRHRWIDGVPGAQRYTTARLMSLGLVALGEEARRRAGSVAAGSTPSPTRHLLVVDDLDATRSALAAWWDRNRACLTEAARVGDPMQRRSPAIDALQHVLTLDACWRINALVSLGREPGSAFGSGAMRRQYPARVTRRWVWGDLVGIDAPLDWLLAVVDGRPTRIHVPILSACQARRWSDSGRGALESAAPERHTGEEVR